MSATMKGIARINPVTRFTRIAALGTLALFVPLSLPLSLPLAYLAAISLVTLVMYGYDKSVAGTGQTRVPEKVFYGMAIAGGSVAALVGQQLFRHKTRKANFQAVCIGALLVQAGLAVFLMGQ